MRVFLAEPRGFCAGVDRAIEIVKIALARHGAPVYVKHQIVHNPYVVKSLEQMGAVTVEDVRDGTYIGNQASGPGGPPEARWIRCHPRICASLTMGLMHKARLAGGSAYLRTP